jgi:pimeloyl-ACP methyl ester carboxylesterase
MPVFHTKELDFYYEMRGEGVPLVFIHGLGSSTLDWEYQLEFFSKHFQTLCIDLRGHGKSGKPPGPYSVSQFAADTVTLFQHLKLPPAHITGLSMGGMIAFQLALDAPQLVRSISIINSGPELILRTFAERMAFFQRRLIIRFMGMEHMAQLLAKMLLPEPQQASLQKALAVRWGKNDKKAYLASLDAIINWSVANRISDIKCPTLVVAADKDYTPVSFKEAYVAKIPRAQLSVIHNSRHLTPLDQPEQLNDTLLRFLSQS